MKIKVIGAGLAGCEVAYRLANHGVTVDLYEMKPNQYTPAHQYKGFGELVCSNSLKADRVGSAAGLLKYEMNVLGSLILEAAEHNRVPAGGALAVNREKFSDYITNKITTHPNINVISERIDNIPDGECVVIASGPLTTDKLSTSIKELCGENYLSFFDAAAPIVTFESLDTDKTFFAARYDRGDADYINCPMDKDQYEEFHNALIKAEAVELKEFEKNEFKVYEGCMPVEVMGKRGKDTLRFGPLKPVGLTNPHTDKRPYAVVQLRKENSEGSLYNLVGFQTNLKFPEQKKVFSKIPGLEQADFVRYGVMHRNTFINSPKLLDNTFNLKKDNRIYFAGQITGVEGYIESAMSGIVVAENIIRRIEQKPTLTLPRDTMIGALTAYISDETVVNFQPMGCNMGILPPTEIRIKDKKERYDAVAQRAIKSLQTALAE